MSAIEEHLATRRAAGLFDFSFMGVYEYPDEKELARLQTRSLAALAPGRIFYTLVLNSDGSVFNDATVWHLPDGRFWLFTGRRSDFARLGSRARDRSGEFAILALQGPASGRILASLIGAEAVRSLKYFHFTRHDTIVIGRLGYSGELGYELLVPTSDATSLRKRLLQESGARECGWDAADSLRMEAGFVLFDREIDGCANPRELGLERLVDDRTMKFALTRRLGAFELLEDSPAGGVLRAQLTSECFAPTLGKRIGLGFCAPDAIPGDVVSLSDGRSARLAPRAFYDPDRRLARAAPW
jgi:glycine cleavage system aminomethyltransferase T